MQVRARVNFRLAALSAPLLLALGASAQTVPPSPIRPPTVSPTPAPAPSAAPQPTMRFSRGWSGGNYPGAEWIAAEGPITSSTPEDFRRFLRDQSDTRYTVYLDSPGGNLAAGLVLGLMIRERGLSTAVARTTLSDHARESPRNTQTQETRPGRCVSACAYAFLGGVDRSAKAGEIGFHQFYAPNALLNPTAPQFTSDDVGRAQATVGLIALYLKEMRIDPEVLHLASQQNPNSMSFPPEAEMRRLKIINTSTTMIFDPWSIEPVGLGAVVATRGRFNSILEERIALHCRRSSPNQVVLRGAWTFGVSDGPPVWRPPSGAQATAQFREVIREVSLSIGRQTVRSHQGAASLLDARVEDDGTYRIAFVMSMEEVRRGLVEGFSVGIELPAFLGRGQTFAPPLNGLSERLNIVLRSCV